MRRATRLGLPAVWILIGLLGGAAALFARPAVRFSATAPPVNETHIFEGGVNRRGAPVGFHSRPGGRDPEWAHVVAILRPPNRFGVYEARVEIVDRRGGRFAKRSTFYPDGLDRKSVIAAILNAYRHRGPSRGAAFRGPSGLGFTIEGTSSPTAGSTPPTRSTERNRSDAPRVHLG